MKMLIVDTVIQSFEYRFYHLMIYGCNYNFSIKMSIFMRAFP